jgi:hypothetical protein
MRAGVFSIWFAVWPAGGLDQFKHAPTGTDASPVAAWDDRLRTSDPAFLR